MSNTNLKNAYGTDEIEENIRKYYVQPAPASAITNYENFLKQHAGDGKYDVSKDINNQAFSANLNYADKILADNYYKNHDIEQARIDSLNSNMKQIYTDKENALRNAALEKEITEANTESRLKNRGLDKTGVIAQYDVDNLNAYYNNVNSAKGQFDTNRNAINSDYNQNKLTNDLEIKNNVNAETKQAQSVFAENLNAKLQNLQTTAKSEDEFKNSATDLINQYKSKIDPIEYEAMIDNIDVMTPDYSKQNAINNGITEEQYNRSIDNASAEINNFGSFSGSGATSNGLGVKLDMGDQDLHVRKVLNYAKYGKVNNGDIYDFNLGGGTACFVYYDGRWYPTDKKWNKKVQDINDQYFYTKEEYDEANKYNALKKEWIN